MQVNQPLADAPLEAVVRDRAEPDLHGSREGGETGNNSRALEAAGLVRAVCSPARSAISFFFSVENVTLSGTVNGQLTGLSLAFACLEARVHPTNAYCQRVT